MEMHSGALLNWPSGTLEASLWGLTCVLFPAALALAITGSAFLFLLRPQKSCKLHSSLATARSEADCSPEPSARFPRSIAKRIPHVQGFPIPVSDSQGFVSNAPDVTRFENENCTGEMLIIHRPTWNKELDRSGDYAYGEHMRGRKRLWEVRVHFHFKRKIENPRFGIELEKYKPLNAAARRMMELTVSALRQVVGKDLYHSIGDDPAMVEGEAEKPVFAMPLWAWDQYIFTPEGEQPPSLMDPGFANFGLRRTDDLGEFIKEVSALEMGPGPTYTFAFWGISRFLDVINWQVTGVIPFKVIPFDTFCGGPPIYCVMYSLKDEPGESRHLQSRKSYCWNVPLWSSTHPPNDELLRKLVPDSDHNDIVAAQPPPLSGWQRFLACCASQRSLETARL